MPQTPPILMAPGERRKFVLKAANGSPLPVAGALCRWDVNGLNLQLESENGDPIGKSVEFTGTTPGAPIYGRALSETSTLIQGFVKPITGPTVSFSRQVKINVGASPQPPAVIGVEAEPV